MYPRGGVGLWISSRFHDGMLIGPCACLLQASTAARCSRELQPCHALRTASQNSVQHKTNTSYTEFRCSQWGQETAKFMSDILSDNLIFLHSFVSLKRALLYVGCKYCIQFSILCENGMNCYRLVTKSYPQRPICLKAWSSASGISH